MKERLQQLQIEALSALEQAADLKALQDVRVKILGKKGALTDVMKGMRNLDQEERPAIGSLVNTIKDSFEDAFGKCQATLQQAEIDSRLANEKIDTSLPGRRSVRSRLRRQRAGGS